MRCEARTLDDIRALGGNDLADERRFDAAARLSEVNLALYRTFAQPWVRAMATPPLAETMRRLHPLRLSYEMFGPRNPFLAWVAPLAQTVREHRAPAAPDNPFLALQARVSDRIVEGLEGYRKAVEATSEETFRRVYGAPALQSALGVDTTSGRPPRKAAKDPLHARLVEARIAELRGEMATGGLREATIRALLHVGMAGGGADERRFAAIRRLRREAPEARAMTLAAFKAAVREQYFLLLIDEEAALAALPGLLPGDEGLRRAAFAAIRDVLAVGGPLSEPAAARLGRIATLFGLESEPVPLKAPGRRAS